MEIITLDNGIRFGYRGERKKQPVLFNFCSTISDGLESGIYGKITMLAAENGFACVSVDLPCHGLDIRPDDVPEIAGWSNRVAHGEDFVTPFLEKCSKILDWLFENDFAEIGKISVSGTSRGGFLAMHWTAFDIRVTRSIGFAPVSDLAALREFKDLRENPVTRRLALSEKAARFGHAVLYNTIANLDERVDSNRLIAFTQRVIGVAKAAGKEPDIELHLTNVRGHASNPEMHVAAWDWLQKSFETGTQDDY